MPSPLQVQTAEEGVVHQARNRTVMGEGVPKRHNNTIHPNQCIHNTDTKPHDNPTTLVTMVHPPIRVAMAVEGVVSSVSTHPFSQQSWNMGSRGRGRMQSYQIRCPFNCPHCPPRRQYPNPQPFTHSNRLPRDQGTPQN